MSHKLSIIIPCYNSEKTLEEALVSVYKQNIKIPFEVVMVDDGSTDATRELIKDLSKKYDHIRYFFHEKNMGGGATRNTAVKNSEGYYIFCLDSDDILGDGTLGRMVEFAEKKSCDGVGVSTSIKFKGKNINDIAFVNNFGFVGEIIPFESVIEREKPVCPLYSVFLFTKDAFDIVGGYPTDHGFDTQGFAFRFLANGLRAYTCPDTTYLHRINFTSSYYIREYEGGKINHNWFKIFDEFIYLFNESVQETILNFELNNSTRLLLDSVKSEKDLFKKDYQKFLKPKIKDELILELSKKTENSKFESYWLGSEYVRRGKFDLAAKNLLESVIAGLSYPGVYYKLYSSEAMIGGLEYGQMVKSIDKIFTYEKQGREAPFLKRIYRKIFRILKI